MKYFEKKANSNPVLNPTYLHMSSFKGVALVLAAALSTAVFATMLASAQSPQMEQKLAAIKQAAAANKQKLAQYTWQETETVSIKGSVKDTKVYQIKMVNGKQQKTLSSEQKAPPPSGGGRLKEHMIEKETQEFQEYGQAIGALAKQYTTPDPDAIAKAKEAGNISVQPGSSTVSLVIKNYVKQGDSVTMTISEQTHSPVGVEVNSYLNDPSDAVTISAKFAQLPDSTNHVATTTVNGVSKHLTISEQNSNYQKM